MLRASLVSSTFALSMLAGNAFGQTACTASSEACQSSGVRQEAAFVRTSAHAADKDIVDTAVSAGTFNTLAAALKAAGLIEDLKGAGPFTVFAPTDEAFSKLPKGTLESLLKPENKAKLVSILTYHVVPGSWAAKDVAKLTGAGTLNGQRVEISSKGGKVMVDGATVTGADVRASNGVIHVIDRVILPSDKDIVETAAAAGNFNTLAAALASAGLVDTLKGDGPFTVFAPTDEAFAKLPKGTVEGLLKPENKDKLVSILKYHVVKGRVYSDDAVKAGTAPTLQGSSVTVSSSGGVMIDNARVIKADLDTRNGVIHVIDTVIMPK